MFTINGMIIGDERKEIDGTMWRLLMDPNHPLGLNWYRAIPIEPGDEDRAINEVKIITKEVEF